MRLDRSLARYYELEPQSLIGQQVFTKPGVRGYPDLHPGVSLLVDNLTVNTGRLIDATGSAGVVAAGLRRSFREITVLEGSRAALTCVQKTFKLAEVTISAGAPWNAPDKSADTICLIPATDRGTARVSAELLGAFNALKKVGWRTRSCIKTRARNAMKS